MLLPKSLQALCRSDYYRYSHGAFLVKVKELRKSGKYLVPIIIVWIFWQSLGITRMVGPPQILAAINPLYAINFFLFIMMLKNTFLVLGSVMLIVNRVRRCMLTWGILGEAD